MQLCLQVSRRAVRSEQRAFEPLHNAAFGVRVECWGQLGDVDDFVERVQHLRDRVVDGAHVTLGYRQRVRTL